MTTLTDAWRPAKPGETPGQMTPECTRPEHCVNEACTNDAHMPDREDTWTAADDAAWLWDDDVQRRRSDR